MRVDIDHIGKPFVQLCDEFMAVNKLTYCDVPLIGPPNLKKFKDQVLWRAWQLFHEMHARLAPSLPRANRGAGAGASRATTQRFLPTASTGAPHTRRAGRASELTARDPGYREEASLLPS